MTYIFLANRYDAAPKRKCLKPDDLDSAGRRCGKRAKGGSEDTSATSKKKRTPVTQVPKKTKPSSKTKAPAPKVIEMPNTKPKKEAPSKANMGGRINLSAPKGQIIRTPTKFMKGKPSGFSPEQINDIADVLKANGRNSMPVMVKQTDDNRYEVVGNNQIWEAAKKAKLDFIWSINVDDEMEKQMAIEMGQARLKRR